MQKYYSTHLLSIALVSYFLNRKAQGLAAATMKNKVFTDIDNTISNFFYKSDPWINDSNSKISFGIAKLFRNLLLVFWNMESLSLVNS